ncbi:MAG: hypothetical protein WA066_00770 [Candidatus Omnitrophota bacterium]
MGLGRKHCFLPKEVYRLKGRGDRSESAYACHRATPEGKPLVSPWGVNVKVSEINIDILKVIISLLDCFE